MNTEVFSRIVTLDSVDCMVVIFRKDMPEKRLLMIWSIIIPHAGASIPNEAQCNRWADECFGTLEQLQMVSKVVSRLRKVQVDNFVSVAVPGTPVQEIAEKFELTAYMA
jgi:hypothetical protein